MKKFLPTIFILLIIANLFAPFSVSVDKNNTPVVKASVAEATDTVGIKISGHISHTDTNITPWLTVVWYLGADNSKASVLLQKVGSTDITKADIDMKTDDAATQAYDASHNGDPLPYTVQTGNIPLSVLPNTTYNVTLVATQNLTFWGHPLSTVYNGLTAGSNHDAAYLLFTITTNNQGDITKVDSGLKNSLSIDAYMPPCSIVGGNGTIAGCAAQLLYYVLFIPTSYIFALTGQMFDFTFFYSVKDTSYQSPFVLNGWGIIRDFCNMFFIFVLLYIAFATILDIHGFKTKEMIINVIIIGLLINFSLFAAQLIIDSSNILARVFYSDQSVKITQGGANGVTNNTPKLKVGPNGELPLSAAIVNKVNPQNLIINGVNNVGVDDPVSNSNSISNTTIGGSSLNAGGFILIVLLAVAVNVVGIIVFVSVSMIFITRVIGLWMAMVFAPLAFFSYAVPKMKSIDMIGWEKWWPETIKLAFLAPVFMFFLYLIIQFLDTGLSLINIQGQNNIAFIVATVVPFAFIMILLWKAKSIASEMSGKLGQTITGGIATIGGLALGGAALGVAFSGRKIIGERIAARSRTADSIHYGKEKIAFNKKLEDWEKNGKKGDKPKWKDHAKANNVKTNLLTKLGGNLNAKQTKINEVDHARHEIDTIKDKAGLKGVNDDNLSGVDKQKLATTFAKEKKTEIESEIRRGTKPLLDENGKEVKDANNEVITGGESGFKAANRDRVTKEIRDASSDNIHTDGGLTDAAKKKVEDQLNVQFNAILKTSTDKETEKRFNHLQEESKQKVGGFDRVFAQSNKGSYDVRNLSQTKVDKRERAFTKMSAGLIAGIAMGVRTGLKHSNVNHGSGQGDFLKDIGNTITEALKSTKLKVEIEKSHGTSGGDAHTTGGGHH
ncbi:MAG: hypothetical protein KGI58_00190 [Patescibacteria group bacterium]|nr:hypothetical protein [Patescibacteria group bacterium]